MADNFDNIDNTENNINSDPKPKEQNEVVEKPKKKSVGREILEWIYTFAIVLVIAFLIKGFVFELVMVDGRSMDTTLADGQRLIVTKLGYQPKNGDIVILDSTYKNRQAYLSHYSGLDRFSKNLSLPKEYKKKFFVKRVIATEGQTVEITDGKVYVDGNELHEDYIQGVTYTSVPDYKTTVEEGCIFVMGDNREHSSDSRNPLVGQIPVKAVLGKAQLRIFPFNQIGSVYK